MKTPRIQQAERPTPPRTEPWSAKAGATILEILVVLSIIAMIAAVIAPRVIGYLGRAKSETATLQIRNIRSAVQLFYVDTGRYPSEAEGLSVLTAAPGSESGWDGPYLDAVDALKDPWGREYIYAADPAGADSFKIQSFGRDGTKGGSGEDADLSM